MSGVANAVLPSRAGRPNPLVAGDSVFASLFAPGSVCAVARNSGELLWTTNLDSHASSSVSRHAGVLYATSSRTLFALNPRTGKIRWQFSPKSKPGEWIYSLPAVKAGRLFLGDRCGNLHCLDAKTGNLVWRRQTSRGENNQANSTALITGSSVIAANNQGVVICYSIDTGATLWRQKVDGACTGELLRYNSKVLVAAKSLYAIDLKSGAVKTEWNFPAKVVRSVAALGSRIAIVLGTDFQMQPSAWNNPSAFDGKLVVLERGQEIARCNLNGTPDMRIEADTGLIYTADHSGLAAFRLSDASLVGTRRGEFALPQVAGGRVYALSGDGELSSVPESQAF